MTIEVFIALIIIAYFPPRIWLAWELTRAQKRAYKAAMESAERTHEECRRQFVINSAMLRPDSHPIP